MPEQIVQRGKVKFEYNLDVLYWGMSHRDVMINFVFPQTFYSALYFLIGLVAIVLVWVQWLYHWFLSEIRYPPRLFNFQYISFMFPPILKGLILVLLPVIPAGLTLTAIVRGHMFGATMPWKRCEAANTPNAECKLGIFDHFAASWDPESAMDQTSFEQRRTGRMGVMLLAAGSYLAILSLKAFIPSTISKFYDAHSPQARAAMQMMLGPNHENKPPQRSVLGANSVEERNKRRMLERDDKVGKSSTYAKMNDPNRTQPESQVDGPNNPFEVRKAETVDDRDMPIFITYIWKRSCM